MREFIERKAVEAGFDQQNEFASHFGDISQSVAEDASEEDIRAAKVKNISLKLLGIESPKSVLDLFEQEFITVSRTGMPSKDEPQIATIEELFMFLYFFKTQIRNMSEAQGQALIRDDYRVNLLVQMIFNQYDPAEV